MWKNFFYFNRGQRIGVLVLLFLIVLSFSVTIFLPKFIKKDKLESGEAFLKEAKEFRANLIEKERSNRKETDFYPFEYRTFPKYKPYETKYELFAFNPNTADSVEFVKLGLKPYVARNILRYREKGGVFKTVEAFSKVYGMSPEKYEELKPFIQIPATVNEEIVAESISPTEINGELTARNEYQTQHKTDDIIDLNSADTTLLKQVRGIGPAYARRIVNYRKVLGGYSSVDQLKEVYGMTDETFNRIIPYLTIEDESLITKIDVNKASVEKLKNHPYIKTFQRAKAIYEYRRKKVKLIDIKQLSHLEEFTEDDWIKLEPYLSFE